MKFKNLVVKCGKNNENIALGSSHWARESQFWQYSKYNSGLDGLRFDKLNLAIEWGYSQNRQSLKIQMT